MPQSHPRSLRALSFGFPRKPTSPGPPSPTFSEATNASAFNFGANGPSKIITRTDLKTGLQAYEDLMTSSASYRSALLAMSNATAAFANAMERCSGLKGSSYEAGTRLQAAAGVHHLVGNLWHVLAETLDKKFEKPLRQHLDAYKTIVNERSASYERALREKSQVIRQTEMRNLNRKERNLQSFREALTVLQRQVDELDELKAAHYQEIVEHEEEVWDVVQNKVCIVVRSTMDVFDRFTAKASDPIIEPMLQSVPDPFDAYGPPQSEDQIFSILAPLSIMNQPASSSSTPSPMAGTPERDPVELFSSSMGSNKVTSWLPTTSASNGSNSITFPTETTIWAGTPPSSSPPSASPNPESPPQSQHLSRRHSVPSGSSHRRTESKLRSVLSVIDESRSPRHESFASSTENNGDSRGDDTAPASTSTLASHNLNGTAPPPPAPDIVGSEPGSGQSAHSWSFTYGQSPYEYDNSSNSSTPRNSLAFTSSLPPAPPDSLLSNDSDLGESNDLLRTAHTNM